MDIRLKTVCYIREVIVREYYYFSSLCQKQLPEVFYKAAVFRKHPQENTCVGVSL